MTKAEKTPSVLLTCAHGLSSVSESLKHHVFVTFTLHFIFFASTLVLWTVGTGVLEPGKRAALLSCLQLTCWLAARKLVLMEVEICWPGHIFYLFNYVSQQNLIVNKEKILLYTFQTPCILIAFFLLFP